jgi:ABC-type phosphate/phosphonate transport system substrate-binding protein
MMRLYARTISLCFCLLACLHSISADQGEKSNLVHVIFTSAMVSEMNPRDAVAAVQVFGEQVLKRRGLSAPVQVKICDQLNELRGLLKKGEAEIIALRVDEYFQLELSGQIGISLVGVRDENWAEQYVLLARAADGLRGLVDLSGKRLVSLSGRRMGLAAEWLNIQLRESNLPEVDQHFGQVKQSAKVSGAVLPVFFKQADACITTQSGFETMSQLNPQLGKQLSAIKISPSLLPSLICLRKDLDPDLKEELRQALLSLHTDTGGQQVLTLFALDKLIPLIPAHISSAREIYNKYRKGSNSGQAELKTTK